MISVARLASGLVFLVLSCTTSHACHLSLLGAVTQQPLTYNPFDAVPSAATVTFILKNTDLTSCQAAFAFFRSGTPQATGPSGASLNYQILAPGPVIQNAVTPPSTLTGAFAQYFTVGGSQTFTVTATLSVSNNPIVPPGTYTDTLSLGIYQSAGAGPYTLADVPVTAYGVTIGVTSQMAVAIAGGGLKTTLYFGDFVQGATRSVQLQAYSNQAFRLIVSSDNAGVMKPTGAQAIAEGIWQVPYTVAVNGAAPISLSQQRVLSLWPQATQQSGIAIPIDVQIGAFAGQRAGVYRDVITIAIDASP
jgi:hypothetical protein